MRYLITGGLGFLGVNLAKHLMETDDHAEIVIVDPAASRLPVLARFVDPGRIAVDTVSGITLPEGILGARIRELGRSLAPGRVEVHLSRMRQLSDYTFLGGWLPDRVYHLASHASPVMYRNHPIDTLHTGAIDTMQALSLIRHDRGRMLLASTSEVYGDPDVSPQPETYRGRVSPIGPRSMYDESKRFAEALVAAHVDAGQDCRIARIFNTYGPGMARGDGRLIPALLTACEEGRPLPIHGTGHQTRSLCYVDDTIRGIVALMESDSPHLIQREGSRRQVQPVNIGNPDERPVRLIAERAGLAWAGITGSPPPGVDWIPNPCPDDPTNRRPDIARARSWLGWEPSVDLDEGLRLTVEDWIAARS